LDGLPRDTERSREVTGGGFTERLDLADYRVAGTVAVFVFPCLAFWHIEAVYPRLRQNAKAGIPAAFSAYAKTPKR
jgi:hypothetical protein